MDVSLVFPHQLYERHPALKKGRDVYLFEDGLYFGSDPHWPLTFHKKKLILHRASMKAYEASLRTKGYKTHYIDCESGVATGELMEKSLPKEVKTIHFVNPVDDLLLRRVKKFVDTNSLRMELYDSPNFLSSEDWLHKELGSKKKPFMATFYKAQRKRLNILVNQDGDPVGGKWSFDEENRKKLPKSQVVPELSGGLGSGFVKEASKYVEQHFPEALGSAHGFAYAVDRKAAKHWLSSFLKERFHLFGDYEDAISTKHRIMFHSVLTPALNIGLLSPDEVLKLTLSFADKNEIALNNVEGFVRQIIGWREFMRAMYLQYGVRERNANFWNFEREMPASFYNGTTGVDPIDETIHRVLEDGYCHHIERLMVLGNFMLLCRIHPTAVYKWFMELFVDAYDWVMVPNVYGMSQFADGGIFTTKPYLSGSNYIRKMSDYKKGDWCDVWDGLFWTFIEDYKEVFLKNHRMAQMGHMHNRMAEEKRVTHRENAEKFLAEL